MARRGRGGMVPGVKRADRPSPPAQWCDGVGFRVLGPGAAELTLAPGARTPAFRHAYEARRYVLRSGDAVAVLDGVATPLAAEAPLVVPCGVRAVLHGGPAVVRLTLRPPGAEAALAAIAYTADDGPPDPDDVAALLTAAGITVAPGS